MNNFRGFYKMHRGWMDNDVFPNEPLCKRAAFVWLIENAAWKPTEITIKGNKVKLNLGELLTSLRFLSTAWQWPKTTVARFIENLEETAMLSTSKISGQTLVKITNYEKYQTSNLERDSKRDKSGTASGTPNGTASGTAQTKAHQAKPNNTGTACGTVNGTTSGTKAGHKSGQNIKKEKKKEHKSSPLSPQGAEDNEDGFLNFISLFSNAHKWKDGFEGRVRSFWDRQNYSPEEIQLIISGTRQWTLTDKWRSGFVHSPISILQKQLYLKPEPVSQKLRLQDDWYWKDEAKFKADGFNSPQEVTEFLEATA